MLRRIAEEIKRETSIHALAMTSMIDTWRRSLAHFGTFRCRASLGAQHASNLGFPRITGRFHARERTIICPFHTDLHSAHPFSCLCAKLARQGPQLPDFSLVLPREISLRLDECRCLATRDNEPADDRTCGDEIDLHARPPVH